MWYKNRLLYEQVCSDHKGILISDKPYCTEISCTERHGGNMPVPELEPV